jgi:hypothetical protein
MILKRAIPRASVAVGGALLLMSALQGPALADVRMNVVGGYGIWQADPEEGRPGDAIRACDDTADGLGITVHLYWSGGGHRYVTTRGHRSPYCTPWNQGSGNLPEGLEVEVHVLTVKGGRVYDRAIRHFHA